MDLLMQVGLSNAVVATILGVTTALIGWASRRPALAHALWLLVLLKLITPPLYSVEVSWFASPQAAEAPVAELNTHVSDVAALPEADSDWEGPLTPAEEQDLPANDHQVTPLPEMAVVPAAARPAGSPFSWRGVVPVLWIAGSFVWLTLATVRLNRFRRLLRYAWPVDSTLQKQVQRLARRLSLSQCPQAWFMPGRISPLLWAFGGTPSLILPHGLLDRLSAEQLEALLTHELAHVRRRDHWVRALEFVTTCLFWWHPVVWWARREIREAEEQCCDAWVVWAMPETVRGYALALVETVDFLSEARPALPPATTGIGYVRDLRRRMTMIMRGTTPRALTWSGGLIVLGVAAFMLPMLPTLAQGPPPGRSAPDDDLKGAEADLQQAAARLEQAKAQADQAR
ncbi:MAG TPA: M56 family metallopeptidase, partial [Gemmataceae bacterium]